MARKILRISIQIRDVKTFVVTGTSLLGYGLFGGFIAEVVSAYALREGRRQKWKHEIKHVGWYVFMVIGIGIGGGLAYVHGSSGSDLTPWLAMNVGLTGPLVLRRGLSALNPRHTEPTN